MQQWHYTKGGQQQGPVNIEELRKLIGSGEINPATDLVWNPSMTDWRPAAEIPVLMGEASAAADTSPISNQPFAYPTATGAMAEITPGSEPIIATACLKRAFDLTVKNIGPLLIVLIVYIAITFAVSLVFTGIGAALGIPMSNSDSTVTTFGTGTTTTTTTTAEPMSGMALTYSIVTQIISSLLSCYLLLGITRIALNAVSGKEFSVGMMFGQGDKVIRAFFAQILFGLMVGLGLLLFVFPGIYLALRYSQYMAAIVDKDMEISEAFSYSARLTENNKVNLFVIFLLTICVFVAGCVALLVGLLFAYPMIILMWAVAYRWMQYGGRAVLDDPATGQPLLAQAPE